MIPRGRDQKLSQAAANMPDVSAGIAGWFSPIEFTRVQKRDVGGIIQESLITVKAQGMIQPLSATQVALKPEGQRAWKWLQIHCILPQRVEIDDIIEISCERYRVTAIQDYSRSGYIEFHCGLDYREAL